MLREALALSAGGGGACLVGTECGQCVAYLVQFGVLAHQQDKKSPPHLSQIVGLMFCTKVSNRHCRSLLDPPRNLPLLESARFGANSPFAQVASPGTGPLKPLRAALVLGLCRYSGCGLAYRSCMRRRSLSGSGFLLHKSVSAKAYLQSADRLQST